MKILLLITAVIETATGMALLLAPSAVVWILLGSALDTPSALILGRVTGSALLALGTACGLASRDESRRAVTPELAAMLLYNVAVAALLVYASIGLELAAIGLWPAVVLHGMLALACSACLTRRAFGFFS